MIRAVLLALLLAAPAMAQQSSDIDPNDSDGDNGGFSMTPELNLEDAGEDGSFDAIEEVQQPQAAAAAGAVLRGLDKTSGTLTDLEMVNGQTAEYGRLQVTLGECRYPAGNPAGDAYAYLVIRAEGVERPVFEGWMIASSPALNALDHSRYDVWVLRCTTS